MRYLILLFIALCMLLPSVTFGVGEGVFECSWSNDCSGGGGGSVTYGSVTGVLDEGSGSFTIGDGTASPLTLSLAALGYTVDVRATPSGYFSTDYLQSLGYIHIEPAFGTNSILFGDPTFAGTSAITHNCTSANQCDLALVGRSHTGGGVSNTPEMLKMESAAGITKIMMGDMRTAALTGNRFHCNENGVCGFEGFKISDFNYAMNGDVKLTQASTLYATSSSNGVHFQTDTAGYLSLPTGDGTSPNTTGPNVTQRAQIGHDTTDDQIVYFGSALRVLDYERQACHAEDNVSASKTNRDLFMYHEPITVIGVACHCDGSLCSTPAQIALEDRGGNAMTHGTVTCSASTTSSTYVAVTANNSVNAGEGVNFDVTNTPSPTNEEYLICITYTVNRQ
jgi:hypothetical protein